MDFSFSEEQRVLAGTVKDFSLREIEPLAGQIERDARLPDDLIKKMSKLGLFGMTVPHELGGSSIGNLSAAIACEQIAYSGTGAWWLLSFNNSIPDCINRFGTDYLKKTYIPDLCEGNFYGSLQFTEEDTGSNPEELKTRAHLEKNHYLINGMKRFSTFGARNGVAIVFTKDDAAKCSAFVVEKNCPGYEASKPWELIGNGGIETVDVYYKDVKVDTKNLFGTAGQGFDILLHWIAIEKIMQCAACVGIAQAALDEAVKYSGSRQVKGKPVNRMQGIQWTLAELYAKLDAARLSSYKAAYVADKKSDELHTTAAAAKLFVVPVTIDIVEKARQLHGAYGYTREFKIDRLSRSIIGAANIATSLEINRSIVGSALTKVKQ
ncbi:MAG TPA: acyl-CoA dehydrogenase family protein [Dehalococcoidales bacterium]|nr:acyl-CoA dehydrogenase family protein [Dehalococcoidales bacterium]